MATLRLPRLPEGWSEQPQLFERYWDEAMSQIEKTLNAILALPEIQEGLAELDEAIVAVGEATEVALAAADAAQAAADQTTSATALANSYPTGVTITATDAGASATITISAHSRVYGTTPPTTVAVAGGSITGLAYDTAYFIYYDQASRLGGTVTYVATTDQTTVAQTGDRHSVGAAVTPVAAGGPLPGYKTTPPGGNYESFS